MSRLETRLRVARSRGRKILIPFLTAGYPDRPTFRRLLLAVQQAGADGVEVGLPFSDPSADGPVIQRASEAALSGGTTVRTALEDLAAARSQGLEIPAIVMTYANPVLAFGAEAFCRAAAAAGADGLLLVDVPLEESDEVAPLARAAGLDTVFLVAPTTPDRRLPRVLAPCSGFAYCVSVTGVTGEKRPVAEQVRDLVARVRRYTDLPTLVGFGVSGPEAARDLAAVSDGVIVGSALLSALGEAAGERAVQAAEDFVGGLRRALDVAGAPTGLSTAGRS